jgi:hypothetical protein
MKLDLVNQKFNRLLVISFSHQNEKSLSYYWNCVCDCGKKVITKTYNLKSGHTKSCGCIKTRKNPGVKNILSKYKDRARRKNIAFELTEKSFLDITLMNCFYCNSLPKNKQRNYIYNGIDRLNSGLGYTLGNSVPCCKICNIMKSNLTVEDFYNHIQKIIECPPKDNLEILKMYNNETKKT